MLTPAILILAALGLPGDATPNGSANAEQIECSAYLAPCLARSAQLLNLLYDLFGPMFDTIQEGRQRSVAPLEVPAGTILRSTKETL